MVEPDCDGLAQFTSVPFTDVQVASLSGLPQPAGLSLNQWTMKGGNGATLAQAGTLYGFPGLMNYTVTYKASGPAC